MAVAVGQYQKNGKQSSLDRETEATTVQLAVSVVAIFYGFNWSRKVFQLIFPRHMGALCLAFTSVKAVCQEHAFLRNEILDTRFS